MVGLWLADWLGVGLAVAVGESVGLVVELPVAVNDWVAVGLVVGVQEQVDVGVQPAQGPLRSSTTWAPAETAADIVQVIV
jgi:hypothetical protein